MWVSISQEFDISPIKTTDWIEILRCIAMGRDYIRHKESKSNICPELMFRQRFLSLAQKFLSPVVFKMNIDDLESFPE